MFTPRSTLQHPFFPIQFILFLTLLIILSFALKSNPDFHLPSNSTAKILGLESNLSVSEILSLTNLARVNAGLNPLRPNNLLTQAAQAKANDMLSQGYFSHTSIGDQPPWYFISATGYNYFYAGENLARDFQSSQDVITAWLNSPAHRQNLLNPNYTEIGLALVSGSYPNHQPTTIIVQLLAQPTSQTGQLSNSQTFSATSALTGSILNLTIVQVVMFLFLFPFFIVICLYLHRMFKQHASRHHVTHPPSRDLWLH
jgi:hypothetical protein